jgi:hypothetical protein
MEYRLIRHALTGETRVIGGDGYVSAPLSGEHYLTDDAELRADWWRVGRGEYNTALWDHPLWRLAAWYDAELDSCWASNPADFSDVVFALDYLEAVAPLLCAEDRASAHTRLTRMAASLRLEAAPADGVGERAEPAVSARVALALPAPDRARPPPVEVGHRAAPGWR